MEFQNKLARYVYLKIIMTMPMFPYLNRNIQMYIGSYVAHFQTQIHKSNTIHLHLILHIASFSKKIFLRGRGGGLPRPTGIARPLPYFHI